MATNEDSQRVVEPRLSPQLTELKERLDAGTHHGEPFEVTLTNRELGEAVAWYLRRLPGVPFDNPQVSIEPGAIEARVETQLGKMRLPATARAWVFVQDGRPLVTVERVQLGSAALPDSILFLVEDQLNKNLAMREGDLPVILDEVELEQGRFTVRGKIR
ncbi:MAG: hypothetical protein GTO63_03755 [Anaerolineae bacterium]|nr:hypothetical protein [Anaerolineae bacterium]NIN94129.1 hypothetical protein [Anaerolineae bacterium]NIQ77176.1 hypothetical protein [Anaerolineae bacterium]